MSLDLRAWATSEPWSILTHPTALQHYLCFIVFHCVSLGFIGFDWVWFGLIGFHLVSLGLIGMLPSLTVLFAQFPFWISRWCFLQTGIVFYCILLYCIVFYCIVFDLFSLEGYHDPVLMYCTFGFVNIFKGYHMMHLHVFSRSAY